MCFWLHFITAVFSAIITITGVYLIINKRLQKIEKRAEENCQDRRLSRIEGYIRGRDSVSIYQEPDP
jgi:hypothetical protein